MSYITLDQVKADLRVTHSDDDTIIQTYIEVAEDYVKRFLNRDELPTLPLDYPYYDSDLAFESEQVPSSDDPIASTVYIAVFLLVRSYYDAQDPDEVMKLKAAAESFLMPYRTEMGV
jgi:hypothetical protein